MSKQATSNGNHPVHTVRHRNIKATIWKNQSENGVTFFNVTITRSYKDDEGWHDTQSFSFDDLPVLAKLMFDAHSFISAQRAKEAGQRSKARENKPEVPAAFRH